ncbi:hypothetical protein SAMN05421858_2376 [Haladaptatus litoreus]|uniref:Uncharacterized protein n=1 Tax=Haladaptatus litoreus TaxID=553468 RepID=A0A1N7B6U6_9EURY|nr:hypothetical protein SAMN05421858_2376 [Haladaptatus litoreus]
MRARWRNHVESQTSDVVDKKYRLLKKYRFKNIDTSRPTIGTA